MTTKAHNNNKDNKNESNNNDNNWNENNNDSDDDENNDKGDDNKLPVDSPHKGQMMLCFDVTFVESENNSRVSGDLRHHVPHLTSLWCDIFTPHRHICIVESSYE